MTETIFPSTELPAYPHIAAELPSDWTKRAMPDALGALVKTVTEGRYAPNIVLSVTRRGPDFKLEELAPVIEATLKDLDGAEPIDSAYVELNGLRWFVHEVGYQHPQAGTLVQLVAVAGVENGGAIDLIQLNGSCPLGADESLLNELRTVIASIKVTLV
ncbi:hypothetical protein ACQQCD_07195 [Pseudarthrobacter sp. J1763]|uniref:hypothetical protein n=1 Tax=Pseudarthrobacter sp. J1763 TaxID=3420445 RepID=UPI003D2C1FEB